LKKIIVSGANGVGKSRFAFELAAVRPEVPVICFDAIKLRSGWQQRSHSEISATLEREIEKDAWILEGGPSLLFQAVEKADALVWLDPPEYVRAWQLASRPWRFLGKTRPELPPGNIDWPWQQYKFAFASLKNGSKVRAFISDVYKNSDGLLKWRCREEKDRIAVLNKWAET
jgi:adenylate kinase family enzyme